MTRRYAEAVAYACAAHRGQVRKGSETPYVAHPLAVSALVLQYGGDEDQAIAALLHDVLEDCGAEHDEPILAAFGGRVLHMVRGCTDGVAGEKAPWRERKEAYLRHLANTPKPVLLVSLCDKLHNANSIHADLLVHGVEVFDRFTAGASGTVWYYNALVDVFRQKVGDQHPAVAALRREVDAITRWHADHVATAIVVELRTAKQS